ncbi:MAG: hypothetical protein ABEI52_09595, partial [Halobacteriaceae archaeon]
MILVPFYHQIIIDIVIDAPSVARIGHEDVSTFDRIPLVAPFSATIVRGDRTVTITGLGPDVLDAVTV